MNAPVQTQPRPPKDYAYAKARSRCIDAFSKLELAVIKACSALELQLNERALIGQRLKKLVDTATLDRIPAALRPTLQKLCSQSEQLLHQRTDIVHSEMLVAVLDTQSMAIFRNSANLAAGKPEARVYLLKDLVRLSQEVSTVAADYEALGPRLRGDAAQ